MKFKVQESSWIDSSLSPEKRAEVEAGMRKFMVGAKQQLIGEQRKKMADEYLSMFGPEYAKFVDEEISNLRSLKSEERFRQHALILLAQTFAMGVENAPLLSPKAKQWAWWPR